MRIYLVGNEGCEHYQVEKVFDDYESAIAEFHVIRNRLIQETKDAIEFYKKEYGGEGTLYENSVTRLSETDPKKIDNYPHAQPFIDEWEVQQ